MIDHCSWNNPGANPYQGAPSAAVYAYADIPRPVQDRLAARMEARDYDDLAVIHRDRIVGGSDYADLREMHFGKSSVCATVDRSGWKPESRELGLVYCESGYCLIVPTVCRNVSRVTKLEQATPAPWVPTAEQLSRPAQSVPEPGTLMMVGLALVILGLLGGRK